MADFPVQINKLLAGACNTFLAPITAAPAVNLADIIALVGAPAPVAPWRYLGATDDDAGAFERDFKAEEYTIAQRNGAVLRSVDQLSYTYSTDLAEVSPENLQLILPESTITTVAAAPGRSAQKHVRGGSFEELTRYRLAFVARRKKSQALVTDPTGNTRGAYVAGILHNVALSADKAQIKWTKKDLAKLPVFLEAYPEDTLPQGQEYYTFIEEQAGVIA